MSYGSHCAQQIEFGPERFEEAWTITVWGHDDGPMTIPLTIYLSQPSDDLLGCFSYKDLLYKIHKIRTPPSSFRLSKHWWLQTLLDRLWGREPIVPELHWRGEAFRIHHTQELLVSITCAKNGRGQDESQTIWWRYECNVMLYKYFVICAYVSSFKQTRLFQPCSEEGA